MRSGRRQCLGAGQADAPPGARHERPLAVEAQAPTGKAPDAPLARRALAHDSRRTLMSACSLWPANPSRAHSREQYSPSSTEASSVSTFW